MLSQDLRQTGDFQVINPLIVNRPPAAKRGGAARLSANPIHLAQPVHVPPAHPEVGYAATGNPHSPTHPKERTTQPPRAASGNAQMRPSRGGRHV